MGRPFDCAQGDLRRGFIGVWRFTADGRIEDLESIAYGG